MDCSATVERRNSERSMMRTQKRSRLRYVAIVGWLLGCPDPCSAFVPINELTSPIRRRKTLSYDGSGGLKRKRNLGAIAMDSSTRIVNQTESESSNPYFINEKPVLNSSTNEEEENHENGSFLSISMGNGVPLDGFEEDKQVLNGSKDSVVSKNPKEISAEDIIDEEIDNLFNDDEEEEDINNNEMQSSMHDRNDKNEDSETIPMRLLWRKRNARTVEEGVRARVTKLSSLLNRAKADGTGNEEKRYVERIIMGLINAVAEEIEDLDVDVTTNSKTPLWRKEVKELRVNFSRLGFKPLRMGGSNMPDQQIRVGESETANLSLIDCADEAFDTIDKDNSGTLDQEEIAEALAMISADTGDKESLAEVAAELVDLYDTNSDGVVDREEYQLMIEDMASLRPKKEGPLKTVRRSVESISKGISEKAAEVASAARRTNTPEEETVIEPEETELGSIVLSDLNLDLRRLAFGGIPLVKKVLCY